MKKLIGICLLTLSLLVACSDSKSQENSPVESAEQITGCWEMIVFPEEIKQKINAIDPWPIKYQWFYFSEDGSLNTMGSTDAHQDMTAADLEELFASSPRDIEYSIPKPGIILTKQLSVKQNLVWISRFAGAPLSIGGMRVEKGTLVMSLFSEKENKPLYSRFLKRMD